MYACHLCISPLQATYNVECKIVVAILWPEEQQRYNSGKYRCYNAHVERLGPQWAPCDGFKPWEEGEQVHTVASLVLVCNG